MTNLDRFKADIERLTKQGRDLALSLQAEANLEAVKKAGLTNVQIKALPDVRGSYESWYSEALALVTQLLPDRIMDSNRIIGRQELGKISCTPITL